jgi:glycerol dehydrogenase
MHIDTFTFPNHDEETFMTQIFGSPGRYVQGFGELHNIRKHLSWIGNSFLVIASQNRINDLGNIIKQSFGEGYHIVFTAFGGDSTKKEVHRLMDIATAEGCKGIIGMGGGKVIDTAKAVGHYLRMPTVIIPTTASNDAATSAIGAMYYENGALEEILHFDRNPDMVLVDTEVIMNAPVRFLIAGMGDTLSTYFGARVCVQGYKPSYFGANATETSFTLARLSYDLLLKYGLSAKIACENKIMTKDLNRIIEANILLSGIGFESNGGASDHCFFFGFLDLTHRKEYMYHGEYVAFSTLCQLLLEGTPKEELDEVYRFCVSIGLPVTLDAVMLGDMNEDEFKTVAKGVLKHEMTHYHPFEVTETDVIGAIKAADAIGKMYLSGNRLV